MVVNKKYFFLKRRRIFSLTFTWNVTLWQSLHTNKDILIVKFRILQILFHFKQHEDLSSLPNPDVFIVCFSLVDKDSLDNVEQFWMPRIRSLGKDIPVILVGTQLDMRKTNEQGHVSDEQGKFFAKQLKTNHYIECSAKMDFKIQDVFEKAVYAKIRHSKRKSNIIRRVFGRWHQT